MINREVLINEIYRIYEENKPLLAELPYRQRSLVMGFLATAIRVIQIASEEELEDYAAFTHYFAELLHSGADVDVPPELPEVARKRFGVEVDAGKLKSALKKIAASPQAMLIIDELVTAFDKASTDRHGGDPGEARDREDHTGTRAHHAESTSEVSHRRRHRELRRFQVEV
ncbi:MAG: hypothetical protein RXR82_06305 [Nitrososphaeria archaeon]